MWKLSGENENKSPYYWRRLPTTRELIEAMSHDPRFYPAIAKTPEKSAVYTKRGKGAQTYVHVILALAYAEYLNPELGIEVREIALRVYAGDVTVLDEFNRNKHAQLEDDHNRVTVREEVRRNNYDLNMILKLIGAKYSAHWSAFHNKGYEGLYNGLNENAIHALKRLKHNQAILDHMGFHELAANMFRTSLAQQYLSMYQVESVMRACEIHKKMGQDVRNLLKQTGVMMPEDMPVVPSIKEGKRGKSGGGGAALPPWERGPLARSSCCVG